MLERYRKADLFVGHAALGSTTALLLGGVPAVMFPTSAEQMLTAQAVARLKAGAFLFDASPAGTARLLKKALSEQRRLRRGAEAFATRHAHAGPEETAAQVAEECIRLVQSNDVAPPSVPAL